MRAIPRWALTGCWASWAGSSRQLCRRALGRTGCRGAGLGHRRAPAPSLGEGFSQEAGSGGSSFPFQGRVGQDGVAEAGRLGPHPSLAPCVRTWPAAGSLPCGDCPRRPQPLPRSPEPAQPPLPPPGGAGTSRRLRCGASAVCPLLCTFNISGSHVGSAPAAGPRVPAQMCVCVCGRPRVTLFPCFDSGACIFPSPWGSSWSSGAPWRPGLRYSAISAPRLRLCAW